MTLFNISCVRKFLPALLAGVVTFQFSSISSAASITGAGNENTFETPYNEDPQDEQGWDPFVDPNDPLVERVTPYYQNDTRDIKPWDVIIKAWDYDPPNAILLRIVDSRPLLTSTSNIDVKVETGYYDANNNLMVETRRIYERIEIKPGETLLSLPFHNDRTHIIHARVIAVRNETPIMPLD